jgi:hypothetical protein
MAPRRDFVPAFEKRAGMVPREELLPELVTFSNAFYRAAQGWESPLDPEGASQRLAQYLTALKARLAWELPLLCAFEEGPAVASEVAGALELLEGALGQLSPADYEATFSPLLERFLLAARQAEALRAQLPLFTDVKIVNELLLLASARLDERIDGVPLAQRLPILLDWIARKELDWVTYARLFPDQEFRVRRVREGFNLMRSGAGAVHLYLEGEEPEGLKEGLSIVLRALDGLAAATETRFLTESERVEFSSDLRLERIWRGADWPSWEGTALEADLLAFCQDTGKRLQAVGQQTLLPGSVLEETLETVSSIEATLNGAFELLWEQRSLPPEQAARPPRAEALASLQECRQALQELEEQLAARLEPFRGLESYPLYAGVLGVLQGVLAGTTPDAYLHQLLASLSQGKESFAETVERVQQEVTRDASTSGAQAQALNIARRFDLPSAGQSAPELILEGAFEVVVQPGVSSSATSPSTSKEPAAPTSGSAAAESVGAPAGPVFESAWEALDYHQQAQEALWSYLEQGDRLLLHDAFELFAEPLLTLTDFLPPKPPEPVAHLVCPFCQESFPGDSERCPGCKRLVTLSERQALETVTSAPLPLGSTLLVDLDRRTSTLSPQANPEKLMAEWRTLARRLEKMSRAAHAEGKGRATEALFAQLVAGCHEVADHLAARGGGYDALREPLMKKFAVLERLARDS